MIKLGQIKNIDKVMAFLKKVPAGTRKVAVIAIAEYLIGDSTHGFKHDDPYRQTTRKRVYGQSFESDAQRRYVMAAIASGEIIIGQRKYSPTQASQAYGYKLTSGGYGAQIENESEGAYWSRVWGGWKNWKLSADVVKANIKGALKSATTHINWYLKSIK